ncbi:hypothetical protein H8959_007109 [Pygathrix nigripes]
MESLCVTCGIMDNLPTSVLLGDLLTASAHFGAYVYGTDIDHNTVQGLGTASRKKQLWRGPDENIRANLRQYGLEKYYHDVLVSDASKSFWRKGTHFGVIITDPPYGIRESTRRTGSPKAIPTEIEKCPESHIPVSLSYHPSVMFFDLLNFSAETLVLGGILVYWLLVYTPEYTEEMVPWHPCLKLVSNCEQKFSSHTSRCWITMEMVKKFENQDSLCVSYEIMDNLPRSCTVLLKITLWRIPFSSGGIHIYKVIIFCRTKVTIPSPVWIC